MWLTTTKNNNMKTKWWALGTPKRTNRFVKQTIKEQRETQEKLLVQKHLKDTLH